MTKVAEVQLFLRFQDQIQSYTDHFYNNNGELIRKIQYNKNGSMPDWPAGNESEYEYINDVLSLEKTYLYV